jgi:hypothetical protein
LQVAQPELAVLKSVGGNVVRAAKVQQQERRPERHQLVLSTPAAERKVSDRIYRGRISQQVRLPEEDPRDGGGLATADSGED